MLARRTQVLRILAETGSVTVSDLSKRFEVAPITIRRDLEKLESEGLLTRVHGGAVIKAEPFIAKPLVDKETLNSEAKEKIALKAAELVNPGETIILDEGSTCIALARALRNHKGITVVTNGIKVASELTPYHHITTILIGGVCGHTNFVTYGYETLTQLQRIRAHKYFMGIDAIQLGFGISDADPHQVELKRAKAASSQEVIGIADNSKLGKIGLVHIGSVGMLNKLVMNSPVHPAFRELFEAEGVTLIEVD
jgi:DeoR/GlpR family transcriptional regulator of sugar metabolism